MMRMVLSAWFFVSVLPICMVASQGLAPAPDKARNDSSPSLPTVPPVLSADEAYAQLRAYLNQSGELMADTVLSAEREARIDTHVRNILPKFLQFYRSYPTDPRRWPLLVLVINQKPHFLVDYAQATRMWQARTPELILIDTAAKHAWESQYAIIRTAFMSAPDVNESQRASLRWWELCFELNDMNMALARGNPVSVRPYQDSLLAFAARFHNGPAYVAATRLTYFFLMPTTRIADPSAMARFLRLAAMSPDTALRNWAINTERLFAAPVALRGWTLQGVPFDVQHFRGKIVLLDFWGTSCSMCIAAFPRLKRLYQRYHNRGVEFVSVALDPQEEHLRVQRLVERNGLPWTHLFAGDSTNRYITQYGITGLPNMMILDRNGWLIGRNFFNDRDIIAIFERLLSDTEPNTMHSM